jgi:hypothetical protein
VGSETASGGTAQQEALPIRYLAEGGMAQAFARFQQGVQVLQPAGRNRLAPIKAPAAEAPAPPHGRTNHRRRSRFI